MPRWNRWLRLALVFGLLGGAIAAALFVEFSDIATRKQIAYQNPQSERRQETNKQEWSAQVAAVFHWLADQKVFIEIISAGVIAVFTGFLVRDTKRLADVAANQSSDMENLLIAARNNARAAASQAESATQQLAALKAANDLTNRIFFAERRPWVNIQEIAISPTAISPTAGNEEWEFDVVVSNTGGSPAHYVRASILKINKGERPNDVIIRELEKNKAVRRAISITVFPRETRHFADYLRIKIDDLHMKPFVVVIEYEFVAGGTAHTTGGTIFCIRHEGIITCRRTPMTDFAT